MEDGDNSLLTQSSSPQSGTKRAHATDDDTDSDADVHVSKAPKIQVKARPKAGDYDEFGKELVLAAANIYRALLASKGAFPNSSMELKLVKKAWKLVNADSGAVPLALTPSVVAIVSDSFRYQHLLILSFLLPRLRLEGRNSGGRRRRKQPPSLRLFMASTADAANVQLQRTVELLRS